MNESVYFPKFSFARCAAVKTTGCFYYTPLPACNFTPPQTYRQSFTKIKNRELIGAKFTHPNLLGTRGFNGDLLNSF